MPFVRYYSHEILDSNRNVRRAKCTYISQNNHEPKIQWRRPMHGSTMKTRHEYRRSFSMGKLLWPKWITENSSQLSSSIGYSASQLHVKIGRNCWIFIDFIRCQPNVYGKASSTVFGGHSTFEQNFIASILWCMAHMVVSLRATRARILSRSFGGDRL